MDDSRKFLHRGAKIATKVAWVYTLARFARKVCSQGEVIAMFAPRWAISANRPCVIYVSLEPFGRQMNQQKVRPNFVIFSVIWALCGLISRYSALFGRFFGIILALFGVMFCYFALFLTKKKP